LSQKVPRLPVAITNRVFALVGACTIDGVFSWTLYFAQFVVIWGTWARA
jgi:hypothetical protein